MESIEQRVVEFVADYVRGVLHEEREVTLDHVVRDLVRDSLSVIELMSGIETEFGVLFDDASQMLIETTGRVRDLVNIVQRVAA